MATPKSLDARRSKKVIVEAKASSDPEIHETSSQIVGLCSLWLPWAGNEIKQASQTAVRE